MKYKLKSEKSESGAFSIEAVISITFFMISVIAVMFISMIVKVQSTIQYALGQTAKEISGYYYLLDKTGLTKLASGVVDEEKTKLTNEAIGNVIDFSSKAEIGAEKIEQSVQDIVNNNVNIMGLPNKLNDIGGRINEMSEVVNKLAGNLDKISDDPVSQLKAIFSVFAGTMANKAVSYFITPYVCRAIMPRYLGGDRDSSNSMLEAMGVKLENKSSGLESLDFSQSELLTDGRSIKLVVVYKINPEKITLGLVKLPEEDWPVFRQTACTAAWISPDGEHTISVKNTAEK